MLDNFLNIVSIDSLLICMYVLSIGVHCKPRFALHVSLRVKFDKAFWY